MRFMNPTSSVKDRISYNMIKTAMEAGKINADTLIIEPTSGNTGDRTRIDLRAGTQTPDHARIDERRTA